MRTSAGERKSVTLEKLPSKMMNNNVLVRIDFNPSEDTVRPSGIIISGMAGVEWNDSKYMPRFGVVVKTPDHLVNRSFDNIESGAELMGWETEVEIKDGDLVYFGAMISANAEALEVDGDLYLLIPYSRIILRVRDEELTPVNGYVLLEEVVEKVRVDGLILEVGDFQDKRLGVVTHNGRNNDSYFASDAVDADVEIGDKVIFSGKFFGHLESDIFAKLPEE